MPHVIAVCVSEKKGIPKTDVRRARLIEGRGIEGDAHAGSPRQVSLLAWESVERMNVRSPLIRYGAFAENLALRGLEVKDLPVGTRLRIGDALIEITEIGKECHAGCEIRRITGDCVMPREGVFAKVLRGGAVQAGDEVILEPSQ